MCKIVCLNVTKILTFRETKENIDRSIEKQKKIFSDELEIEFDKMAW